MRNCPFQTNFQQTPSIILHGFFDFNIPEQESPPVGFLPLVALPRIGAKFPTKVVGKYVYAPLKFFIIGRMAKTIQMKGVMKIFRS